MLLLVVLVESEQELQYMEPVEQEQTVAPVVRCMPVGLLGTQPELLKQYRIQKQH
jgi:hypothetical protein